MALSDQALEKVRGDALKPNDVEAALIGVGVVIQTLGVGLGDLFRPVHLFSDATRVLIEATEDQGVKRLMCVTGFGAGDSCASISSLYGLRSRSSLAAPMRARAWRSAGSMGAVSIGRSHGLES